MKLHCTWYFYAILQKFGECGVTSSLSLLLGPLWPRVAVPVKVLSMGQIDQVYDFYSNLLLFIISKVSKKAKEFSVSEARSIV